VGRWGWSDEVTLTQAGELRGVTQPETIRITKGDVPEF